jgi:hypothetical protein
VPDLDARLAALPEVALAGVPEPAVLARCAAHLRARHELAREYLARIGEWTGLPVVALPWLPGGVSDETALAALAEPLVGPGGPP